MADNSLFFGINIGFITVALMAIAFAVVIYLFNKSERENNKKN